MTCCLDIIITRIIAWIYLDYNLIVYIIACQYNNNNGNDNNGDTITITFTFINNNDNSNSNDRRVDLRGGEGTVDRDTVGSNCSIEIVYIIPTRE